MNETQRLVRRLEAYRQGCAVLTRATSELSPDTLVTVGVATIKIVTEEHVQAIAYGDFSGPPIVIARMDPLGRDASDLEPFARWLVERFDTAQALGVLPRVWLPHLQALETLDVLGHRYARNESASQDLRRMGEICRILAREYRHEGQQVVAIASSLLLDHVATGQSPAEDCHLGALLAWVNPPPSGTASELAVARSLSPAAGVLANYPGRRDDDLVETLRRDRKRSAGAHRVALDRSLAEVLGRAASDEWALLDEARGSFWRLPLMAGALDECSLRSQERIFYALSVGPIVPRNPVPRIREMMHLEDSKGLVEDARVCADPVLRADARRKGRALLGTVVGVEQIKPGRLPCILVMATVQRDLRFRRDDSIKAVGAKVLGKVLSVAFDDGTGGSVVRIQITEGVRQRAMLAMGIELEWVRHDAFPLPLRLKALKNLTSPWMFVEGGAAPPAKAPRHVGDDLIATAQRYLGVRT